MDLAMAGSYKHCCNEDGSFREDDFADMIENLGDAHEACEQMHWMIQYLAGHDSNRIAEAEEAYYAAMRVR